MTKKYPTLTSLLTAYVRGEIDDSILACEIDQYPSNELGAYIFAIVTRQKRNAISTTSVKKSGAPEKDS